MCTEAQLTVLDGAALGPVNKTSVAAFILFYSSKRGKNGCSPDGFKENSERLGEKA